MGLSPLPALPLLQSSVSSSETSAGKSVMAGSIPAMISKASSFSLQSVVVIIVGLLLIAAGIFSFHEVRQTVIETGKTAAKAAALA